MKTYVFDVELEPDEEGWRAFHGPLEHLGASTWGTTEAEALAHLQEVLTMIVEEFTEEGRPLPLSESLRATEGAAVAVIR